jgi:protein arginine N-methyltransferase 1
MDDFFKDKIGFWNNIYGLNFSSIIPMLITQPKVTHITEDQLLCDPQLLIKIDCMDVTAAELTFIRKRFNFVTKKEGTFHGFCVWFDCIFEQLSPSTVSNTNYSSNKL